MSARPIIDVRELTQVFGPMRARALDRVSLQVNSGTVYGLVGPNGSGKTTLVRALCGMQKPTSGTALVLGCDVSVEARKVRRTVGYMSQRFSLYDDLTALENIEFFAKIHGLNGQQAKHRVEEVIALTKLEPHVSKRCIALSGGWRQRVSLATTIIHRPPLLFLDEPTAGIDPVARRELWDLLFDLAASGSEIFVTTQYMDEIERCGEVGYLYLSRLIVTGTPAKLKAQTLACSGGARYAHLECGEAVHAAVWLRGMPYCRGATVFGHSIHALVGQDVSDAGLRIECQAAGFTQVRVRTMEPTLEDVFVALTQASASRQISKS